MTVPSYLLGQLTQEDWFYFSVLTSIDPSRFSRLSTYLDQRGCSNYGDFFSEEEECNHSSEWVTYELLRPLQWLGVTAHEARDYFEHGSLLEEQANKNKLA